MKTIIDCTNKRIKIASYQDDIYKLIEMAKMYETTENLNGGFYSDMVAEIQLQIVHCKNCIKNLQDVENV